MKQNNAGHLMPEQARLLPQLQTDDYPIVADLRMRDLLATYSEKMAGNRYKYKIENLINED